MSHYFLFSLTSIIALAIPGPDFLLVFQTSISKGKRAGFYSALGIAAGLSVHGAAATLGISALLLKSAQAFEVVKWLGAIYLVYLAVQLIIDLLKNKEIETGQYKVEIATQTSRRKYFIRGFFTNVLNVKAALFFVAIVPQFISGSENVALQFAALSFIQVVMAVLWFSFVAFGVDKFGAVLRKRVLKRWLDGATASIFLALAAKLATTSRQ